MTMKTQDKMDSFKDATVMAKYKGAVIQKTGERIFGKEAVKMVAKAKRGAGYNKPQSRVRFTAERTLRGPKVERARKVK